MSNRPIRILVVDDHAILREGVAALIANEPDIVLAGEAENGAEAVSVYQNLRPDVTLMDMQMPGMNGIDAISAIRAEFPHARIIVLTTYDGDVQAVRALKAGASGYLLKSALRKELLDTIRIVHAGRRFVPASIAQEIAIHAAEDPLTEREISVLELVAKGKANKAVAYDLSVSEDTIKAHLRTIYSKLGAGDRTEAVTIAIRRGIIVL